MKKLGELFPKAKVRDGAILAALVLAVAGCGSSGGNRMAEAQSNVQPDIVGGVPAIPHAWPSQAALLASWVDEIYDAQFCGGTVISPDWVITAAHCVDGLQAGDLDIATGISELPLAADPSVRIPAAEIHMHPFYDPPTSQHDVALIKLMTPTKAPALPYAGKGSDELYWDGTLAKAVGWGTLTSGGNRPTKLYEVDVPILNDALCVEVYSPGYLSPAMVCAGDYRIGGVDTCQGDSGGPLMAATDNGWVLIGLTSYGIGCALPGYPGVYTEVQSYADFIEATTGVSPY
jgi:secreted trypsin-like serine protease